MSKGMNRNADEQDGVIDPRHYNMRGQLAAVVKAAMQDPDPVSMMSFGRTQETAHVAIVVLKGKDTLALFELWAKRNRVLHDHSSGMVEALDGS